MSKINLSQKEVQSTSSGCMSNACHKLKSFMDKHSNVVAIASLCLITLSALVSVGLIGMAGALSSPGLLVLGLVLLVATFVVLALTLSKLMMYKNKIDLDQQQLDRSSSCIKRSLSADNLEVTSKEVPSKD